jgi:hypothetical protein
MKRQLPAMFLGLLTVPFVLLCDPAFAFQPPQPTPQQPTQTNSLVRSAEQWVRQLENELDHLDEDIYYERGTYPAGLAEQIDRASRAAARFRQVLRRNVAHQQLMRDFNEMDQAVHQLVNSLERSGDPWLRRQASRIRYPDEQLHFVLQRMAADQQPGSQELLARQAHLLDSEARTLQDLIERAAHRNDPLRAAARDFAVSAEQFHRVVQRGAGLQRVYNEFQSVDQRWQEVVDQINRSPYGLYLRRSAQNVNRVQNQIHDLLAAAMTPPPQQVEPPQQPIPPPQQVVPQRPRPAIEVDIPGLGRFRIPR